MTELESFEMDELLLLDPEPCPSCESGLRWMFCFDDVWRCRSCVRELARQNGWDKELEISVAEVATKISVNDPPTEAKESSPELPF